jgi:glutathione S-transferase
MKTSLTYFAFDGSRGLECRLALAVAGIPFEDVRLTREQWTALKPSTPFGGLPVLDVDGRTLAHSNAILGWVGRTHGLYPTDPWVAAEHDAILQSVEDLRQKLPDVRGLDADAAKAAREAFAQGWLTQWANTVSSRVAGPFLEGEQLSAADLKLFVILRSIGSGTYDHIPASWLDAWPKLRALQAAVEAQPAVHAWLQPK